MNCKEYQDDLKRRAQNDDAARQTQQFLEVNNRDLKQRRRRRQGRRLEKNAVIFYPRISQMPRSVQYVYRSQNLLKFNMHCQRTTPKENTKNKPPSLTFSKVPRTWSFHVVVLQRTAKKCTKNYNARAQLLFCSLNLLFCGVLVAVAVVVCLRSLINSKGLKNGIVRSGQRIERSGFKPWPGTLCCVLVLPLSTKVYEWVLANLMPG